MSPVKAVLGMLVAFVMGGEASAAPDGKDAPQVAFFGFQLINSSLEQTTPAEAARIRLLDDLFREKLSASSRFRIVAVPSEIGQEIATGPAIGSCNGCERDFARRIGANWAAWGTVQKVRSNLNIVSTWKMPKRRKRVRQSVDIRGNTDGHGGVNRLSAAQLSARPWNRWVRQRSPGFSQRPSGRDVAPITSFAGDEPEALQFVRRSRLVDTLAGKQTHQLRHARPFRGTRSSLIAVSSSISIVRSALLGAACRGHRNYQESFARSVHSECSLCLSA